MGESEHSEDGGEVERGVFGNLPQTRPAVRSPRRRGSKDVAGPDAPPDAPTEVSQAKERPQRRAAPPPRRRPAPPSPPGPRARAPEAEPSPAAERGGVEDLAWAGITVAAEAATLGVRLLSRAMEAVRKPPDRG